MTQIHATLSPGAQLSLPWREDFNGLLYVLNGEGDTTAYPQVFVIVSGRAKVRYGQRWIDVEAGETIYVPPGTLHAVRSRDGGEVTLEAAGGRLGVPSALQDPCQ